MKKKNCYDVNDVNAAEIPEFVYESLARSLLPVIQKYYESDEGKRAFAEWKEKNEAAAKDSALTNREDCHVRQFSRFCVYQFSISSIETINPNPSPIG